MFINEIDENDYWRTVDTETGIYLRQTHVDQRDSIYSFTIVDGDSIINIDASISHQIVDKEKRIGAVFYEIFMINFYVQQHSSGEKLGNESPKSPTPKRNNYESIIKKLLETCGMAFNLNERTFGYTETTKVTFDEKVLQELRAWENGYV